LSAGHARSLIGLEDTKYAIYLAEKAASEGWSVRQIEEAVRSRRDMGTTTEGQPRVKQLRPVEIIELEKRLAEHLAAKVKIDYSKERGRVEIRFGSLEELERIYRIIA
jgi:ParB family chromosome partitioning protein